MKRKILYTLLTIAVSTTAFFIGKNVNSQSAATPEKLELIELTGTTSGIYLDYTDETEETFYSFAITAEELEKQGYINVSNINPHPFRIFPETVTFSCYKQDTVIFCADVPGRFAVCHSTIYLSRVFRKYRHLHNNTSLLFRTGTTLPTANTVPPVRIWYFSVFLRRISATDTADPAFDTVTTVSL